MHANRCTHHNLEHEPPSLGMLEIRTGETLDAKIVILSRFLFWSKSVHQVPDESENSTKTGPDNNRHDIRCRCNI